MSELSAETWLTVIDAEVAHPQGRLVLKAEDRLYRLYPRHVEAVRQIPVSIESLLEEPSLELFLKKAYHHILLRDPDPDGYATYLEQLTSATISPFRLILVFRLSAEGRRVHRKIDNFWWYHLIYLLEAWLPERLRKSKNFMGRLLCSGAPTK